MFASLRSLSDSEVLSRTLALTRRERSITLQALLHLNEIEARQLHLKQSFSSMFAYCMSGLGYSESAANLRIRTARCLARFPEVYELLEANEVNPSTISQVSRILTTENKNDVLTRIRNKSQREVEAIVAEYEPRATVPVDRVRTVVVRAPADASAARTVAVLPLAATPLPASRDKRQENHRCNSGDFLTTATARTARQEDDGAAAAFLVEARKVFQFTASEDFEKKFKRIMSLAAHRLPRNASYEQVFELAMDSYLEKHDPSARSERREQRKQKATAPSPAGDAGPRDPRPHKDSTAHTRYVPARVRDQVFLRAGGQCAYVSPGGRRCGSTHVLQVDHVIPVTRGGASTPDNLRLLCAYHNRLEAERLMGASAAGRWRDRVTGAQPLRQ